MEINVFLVFAFALVAFVYASVGFGGGSSYLALLALATLPFQEIRLCALCCNIVVVLGNSILFIRNKQVDWKKNLPLMAASIPLAFLGAKAPIHEKLFFLLLGCSLIAAAALLWFQPEKPLLKPSAPSVGRDAAIGGSIGLLSGLIGIGGGIFLSPVLHFLRWDSARKIAASASLFILVNSVAGIAGQLMKPPAAIDWKFIALLCTAVLIGGQIGIRWSLKSFSLATVRRVTAGLILVAGIEILWKNLLHH